MSVPQSAATSLADVQQVIRALYYDKDRARGVEGTYMWFSAEVGELAEALRNGSHADREGEFADVLAWLATLANLANVDLAAAFRRKYALGCPGCGSLSACQCAATGKP
ncbi:MAG TPA: MazG nucleotide pyrophosphohydrolase domain-containing protein [Pirellulaceae bacterium]|nr:MazG nucleotide pyrophosphohydrolase domain-containing protein [Pirellulaceae bacterium]